MTDKEIKSADEMFLKKEKGDNGGLKRLGAVVYVRIFLVISLFL